MIHTIFIKRIIITLIVINICACDAPQQSQQVQITKSQTNPIDGLTLSPSKTKHLTAVIRPLGTVPYDGFALPIISPDGSVAATQTGSPPPWSAVLAEQNATRLSDTSVSIFSLGWDSSQAELFKKVNTSAMLGRSSNDVGFLIESPRSNGARWIGIVYWNSGDVGWMVADENTNAFAAVGPKGQLAWSRRTVDANHFDLAVKIGDHIWTIPSDEDDWLMPLWSGKDNGLFVLHLKQGVLQATYMDASSSITADNSIKQIKIMSKATIRDAYQSLATFVSSPNSNKTSIEHLIFFHPRSLRLAIWQPRARGSDASVLLADQTTAGLIHSNTQALLTDAHGLILQNLINPNDRRRIVHGIQIPRPIDSRAWPYILAAPRAGFVNLTAMRLLELDD